MGTARRVDDIRRLLAEPDIHDRLLHGSDFPFPSFPLSFAKIIGLPRAAALQADPNLLRRDLRLKEALGFGRDSAERAYELLRAEGVDLRKSERK